MCRQRFLSYILRKAASIRPSAAVTASKLKGIQRKSSVMRNMVDPTVELALAKDDLLHWWR